MKKSLLKKLSDKFGWINKEINFALKEIKSSPSKIDWDLFIEICLKDDDQWKRTLNIAFYLSKDITSKTESIEELAERINEFLYIDECFYVLAIFNVIEEKHLSITFKKNRKSFLNWKINPLAKHNLNLSYSEIQIEPSLKIRSNPLFKFIPSFLGYTKKHKNYFHSMQNNFIYPDLLTYMYLDLLISYYLTTKHPGEAISMNKEKLLKEVFSKAGLLALNIETFRDISTSVVYNKSIKSNSNYLYELLQSSLDSFLNNRKRTQEYYWLIFALVENIKDKYGVRPSFRKLGEILYSSPSTIARRYYEKNKEFNEKKLSMDEIIYDYKLKKAIEESLEKLNS